MSFTDPFKSGIHPKGIYLLCLVATFLFQPSFALNREQAPGISLNIRDKQIKEVIAEIESNSGYLFVQSNLGKNDLKKRITLRTENMDIKQVLKLVFKETPIRYRIVDRQVILFREKEDSAGSALRNFFQNFFTVSGVVKDSTGIPVADATVVIQGDKSKWAITDYDGRFTLEQVASGSVLEVRSIGFISRNITVEDDTPLTIIMKEDTQFLDEVVVTSNYGTVQQKSNLVSSAYQVKGEDLKNLPQGRIDQLLDGLIPGLVYDPQSDNTSSARPRYSVTIRGEASLEAANDPLWIIDGIPMHTGDRTNMIRGLQTSVSPLSFINPQDIESITVLKDASATSLYGADGANGVILVTTKRGRKGKPTIQVSARMGVSKINQSTKFKVLNGEQYMTLAKEAYRNAGNDMKYFPFTDNDMNSYSVTNTDWYDVFYDTGISSMINLNASGGNDKTTYYISGSYFNNKLTIDGNDQQRFSVRARNQLNLNDKLSVDLLLGASYNTNTIFSPGDYYENLPVISPYNADGSFRQYYKIIDGQNPDGSPRWVEQRFFNRLAEREQNDNEQQSFAFQGNLQITYELTNFLQFSSQLGLDYQGNNENLYDSMKNWSGVNTSENIPEGYSTYSSSNFTNWSLINRVNFNKSFDKHHISGLAAIQVTSEKNRVASSSGRGFINDNLKETRFAAFTSGMGSQRTRRSASYIGQASYSYDRRYNLIFSYRRDGNSNFGSNKEWANFASAGVSWDITKEKFFNSELISSLNLKASYGTSGNSRIRQQSPYGVYTISNTYQYGDLLGAGMSDAANPDLSWEQTGMTNIGLNIGILNNRIRLLTEVYRNRTERLLSNLDASRTTGTTRVYRNVGELQNQGIEMTLSANPIKTANVNWNLRFLASHNKNKILKLYQGTPKNLDRTRLEEGLSTNAYYLVEWAGVDPRDGAPLWYDTEGNLTRTYSAANRVATGKSADPDLFGSLNSILNYKNFSLNVIASYTIGGYHFSTFARNVTSDGLNIMSENQSANQLDRWQNEGDLSISPRPLWDITTQSTRNSTRFLYRKTHIKLRNVSLGYNLPKKTVNRLGLDDVNFYVIGDNLLLWTPYDKSNRNSYKQNMSGFPMETSVSLGVNITL